MEAVVCVTGSRAGVPAKAVEFVLSVLVPPGGTVWVGNARGVDSVTAAWCARLGVPVRVWPAAWSRWGRSAGVRRSAEMVGALPAGSAVVAFSPGSLAASPGTAHCVGFARARGLVVLGFSNLAGCQPVTWF